MLRSENPTRPTTIDELLSSSLIAKISQLGVPTKSVNVRWVTEGVVESSDESVGQMQVDGEEE